MEQQPLKMICGWCGTLLRDGRMPLSHGICKPCSDRVFAELIASEAKDKAEGRWLKEH